MNKLPGIKEAYGIIKLSIDCKGKINPEKNTFGINIKSQQPISNSSSFFTIEAINNPVIIEATEKRRVRRKKFAIPWFISIPNIKSDKRYTESP